MQEGNDVYSFGWGEWGQSLVGVDVDTSSTPKLAEVRGAGPWWPRRLWAAAQSLLAKGVVQIACGWSHTSILLGSHCLRVFLPAPAVSLPDARQSPAPFCSAATGSARARIRTTTPPCPRPSLSLWCARPISTVPDARLTAAHSQGVLSIACGSFHTVALTGRNEVITWGCNFHGQLGHGDTRCARSPAHLSAGISASRKWPRSDLTTPTVVAALRDVQVDRIACGHTATMALATDGTVYTWGDGAHGFLGNTMPRRAECGRDTHGRCAAGHNSEQDVLAPKALEDLIGVQICKIAAGGGFMIACSGAQLLLRPPQVPTRPSAEREAFSWGVNSSGQLGQGHEEDQLRPHAIESLRGFRCVATRTFARGLP
jgi:hypothetical protein